MAGSTVAVPEEAEIEKLMRFGTKLLVIGPTGDDKIKMLPLVNLLLQNTTQTVEKLGPIVGTDVVSKLERLQDVIPVLPHERANSAFFYVWLGITIIAVALRMYSVSVIKKRIRPEDWFSLFALFTVIANATAFAYCNSRAMHIWDMSFYDISQWKKALYICEIIFSPAHWAVKMVFTIFYAALSERRAYKIAVWAIVFFVTGVCWATTIAAVFQCKPIDFWNHKSSKCIETLPLFTVFGALLVVSDFAILLLPLSIVWKLRLRLKEKLILVGIFGVGGLVCVFSTMRLIQLKEWFTSYDLTWKSAEHGVIATVELDLLLIITCLPALRAIVFPRTNFSQTAGQSPDNPDNSGRAQMMYEKLRKWGRNTLGGVTRTVRLKSKLGTHVMGDTVLRENAGVLGMGDSKTSSLKKSSTFNSSGVGSSGMRSQYTAGKDSTIDVEAEKERDIEMAGVGRKIVSIQSIQEHHDSAEGKSHS